MRALSVLVSIVLAMIAPANANEPATIGHGDFMAPYRDACHDKIYASCLDQTKVLSAGFDQAKAQHKLAVVIFGFNSCPPCNVLALWLKSPKGAALMGNYEEIDLSIFDPGGSLRPEVFDTILPTLKLNIHRSPPYGVPLFAIVDPQTETLIGKSLLGFDPNDQSQHIAYLAANTRR